MYDRPRTGTGVEAASRRIDDGGRRMGRKRFYAVRYPFQALYNKWEDCERAVHGVSRAQFKGFMDKKEAKEYMSAGPPVNSSSTSTSTSTSTGGKRKRQEEGGGGARAKQARRQLSADGEEDEEEERRGWHYSQDVASRSDEEEDERFPPPPPARTIHGGAATLSFDGGARGNPGRAGCGAVLTRDDTGEVLWSGSLFLGRATNNVAEYQGLLLGLAAAKELGVGQLLVKGDSKLVVNQVSGRWKVEKEHLKPLHTHAQQLARGFERCRLEFVRREGNKVADRLANEAMDRGR